MILRNFVIKIQMKMLKKIMRKNNQVLDYRNQLKKMMKTKQKEDMLIYINQEELLFNFYRKVEMLIKIVWFVLNGVLLY